MHTASRNLVRVLGAFAALLLLATACSGESDNNTSTETTAATGTTDAPGTSAPDGTDPGGTDPDTTDPAPAAGAYDDPRDGIFDEFQATFDRSHPFQSMDRFCNPGEEAADRQDVEPGITADTIKLVQIRSQLEDFVEVGFGIPIGDPTSVFNAFVDYVNTNCDGIRGRQIEIDHIDVPVLGDVDAERNAACVEATEDKNAVIVMNSTGFQGTAVLCIIEEHDTLFITTQGVNGAWVERGNDHQVGLSPTLEESLTYLADQLIGDGSLEGKNIGVVVPDTPGQPEAVESALVAVLEAEGLNVAVTNVIGCEGGTSCSVGLVDSVSDMVDNDVDVMFNTLNVVSLPVYINEMVTQGFAPGDVQFYQSDFNSHAGDLVSSKVVDFGGETAGEVYNGTIIVDDANTGFLNDPNQEPYAFNEMCAATYAEMGGPTLTAYDEGTSAYGMNTTICSQVRMAMRALYDAGDNPTSADVQAAMFALGSVDIGDSLPASVAPGKHSVPDAVHTMTFNWPCPGTPFDASSNTCITTAPGDEYRLLVE